MAAQSVAIRVYLLPVPRARIVARASVTGWLSRVVSAGSRVRVPCDTELDEQSEAIPIHTFAEEVGTVELEDRDQRHIDPASGWRKAAKGPHVSALQPYFADHQVAVVAKRTRLEVGSTQVRKGMEQNAIGVGYLGGPVGNFPSGQLQARRAHLERRKRRPQVPMFLCIQVREDRCLARLTQARVHCCGHCASLLYCSA